MFGIRLKNLKSNMFYFVGTPIGNLDDTSIRCIKTLVSVDVILSEDTRSFDYFYKTAQQNFGIIPNKNQKIIPYHKENEFEKLPEVLASLKEGLEIALVSECGLPGISDPGNLLLKHVLKEKIKYTIIPSPSAYSTALAVSGFDFKNSFFLGFSPKKENEFRKILDSAKKAEIINTIIFYESPERINKTLTFLQKYDSKMDVCICRELTKKFEEFIFGKPADLINKAYKGELTILIKNLS